MKQKIQLKPEFVTKTDESGRIPLHWAVSKGEQLEREVVKLGLLSLNYSVVQLGLPSLNYSVVQLGLPSLN